MAPFFTRTKFTWINSLLFRSSPTNGILTESPRLSFPPSGVSGGLSAPDPYREVLAALDMTERRCPAWQSYAEMQTVSGMLVWNNVSGHAWYDSMMPIYRLPLTWRHVHLYTVYWAWQAREHSHRGKKSWPLWGLCLHISSARGFPSHRSRRFWPLWDWDWDFTCEVWSLKQYIQATVKREDGPLAEPTEALDP